jgi:hypothetical protein
MPRPVTQYSHVQSVAAATWTIVHGLKTYPICDVYTTTAQKILPASVVYIDQDTLSVSFSSPLAGFATITG